MVSYIPQSAQLIHPCFFITLAPSVGSIFLRPYFQPQLTSKKREFTYFLITTFIPTVMALRWHRVAWKINLTISLLLSLECKHLSDRWITPSIPPKPPFPPDQKAISRHTLAPFKTSLLLQASPLTEEELLHYVLPGNYTVKISAEGIVTLSNKRIEKDVKNWLGKPDEKTLTKEDITSLQAYVLYRSFSSDQRTAVRRKIYETVKPLLKNKPKITIPWLIKHNETPLSFCLDEEKGELLIKCDNFLLSINEYGKSRYQDGYITISNEDPTTISALTGYYIIKAGEDFEEDSIFKYSSDPQTIDSQTITKITLVKSRLNIGLDLFEFLIFKFDQVVAFLQQDSFMMHCEQIFTVSYELLTSFDKYNKELGLVSFTSYKFQNLWNPIIARNTNFGWIMSKLPHKPLTLISTEKVLGQNLNKRVMFLTISDQNFNQIEVKFFSRKDSNELALTSASYSNESETSASDSLAFASFPASDSNELALTSASYSNESETSYLLQKTSSGLIQVISQQGSKSGISYTLGATDFSKTTIEKDIHFILKALNIIWDLKMNPNTIVIDENFRPVNLMEHPIPQGRITLLTSLGYECPFRATYLNEEES